MSIVGSKEWFVEKANTESKIKFMHRMEQLRERFIEKFSPDMLSRMNGEELLLKVFDNTPETMMYLLMQDSDYRKFGASSVYSYMSVIYKGADGIWTLFEKNKPIKMTLAQAKKKAEEIRDIIVSCTEIINKIELNNIESYKNLEKKLSEVSPLYNYVTFLKYFQMIFPYNFVAMYSNETLERCIQILGLKFGGKSSGKRIQNMGIISLFIRNCDINNIVFCSIYADEWDWVAPRETCPAANENFLLSRIDGEPNKSYYRLGDEDLSEISTRIEEDIEEFNLVGMEKESVIKTRVNQGIFRDILLKKYDKCCLCGVSDPSFLVASHIKPWSRCNPKEKLDWNNGFLLCPNHDKLFDNGYITFDGDGKIIISDNVSASDQIFMNVNKDMKISLNEKNKEYLSYHGENVFRK